MFKKSKKYNRELNACSDEKNISVWILRFKCTVLKNSEKITIENSMLVLIKKIYLFGFYNPSVLFYCNYLDSSEKTNNYFSGPISARKLFCQRPIRVRLKFGIDEFIFWFKLVKWAKVLFLFNKFI